MHLGSLESTQEIELFSAAPRATFTHLSCFPNSPRASYLDERTLAHKPSVKYPTLMRGKGVDVLTDFATDCSLTGTN